MFVPPSGLLGKVSKKQISSFNKKFKNTPLRMGVVTECYEKSDEKNLNKSVPEYDVVTSESNAENGQSFVTYQNCLSTDNFGGMADFFQYKLRTNTETKKFDFKKNNGSMVLILCLDGSTEKSIIIGGVNNAARNPEEAILPEEGLHLEGEYNGMNWAVNKDGEFTLTFKSKTDNTGKPEDETAGGTYVKMDKKGSVDINTGLKEKEETYIRMDKENKDVGLKAGANVGFTAEKNIAMNASGKIQGKAKGAVEFAAEGTAKISAKSSLDLEGKSVVNVKGGNVMINGENGVMIQGQQCMIDTPKVFVGQGGTPAVIATTKFVGQGNHGAPVTCQAVGPFSSSVFIAS